REQSFLRLVARLRPGIPIEQAQSELEAIAEQQARDHPGSNQYRGARVISMRTMLVGDVRPALLVLFGAVGLVLLLACSNIAGLTLARVTGRQRELAVRAALGAGRSRIVRQLLTESLLLSLVGAAAGLLLALWGCRLLVELFPKSVANVSIPLVEDIPLDAT